MFVELEEKFDFWNVKFKYIGNYFEDVWLSNIRFIFELVIFLLWNCDLSYKINKCMFYINLFFYCGIWNSVDFIWFWFRIFDKYDMGI